MRITIWQLLAEVMALLMRTFDLLQRKRGSFVKYNKNSSNAKRDTKFKLYLMYFGRIWIKEQAETDDGSKDSWY